MATGILSKGIVLQHSDSKEGVYTVIPDLQEVPDLGGSVDTVEVTTLADGAKRYIKGIKDFGDLEFTFLYDNSTASSNYRIMRGLEEAGTVTFFQVLLPDGTKFTFSGQVTTTVSGAGVGDALTFVATITLNSDMEVENPA